MHLIGLSYFVPPEISPKNCQPTPVFYSYKIGKIHFRNHSLFAEENPVWPSMCFIMWAVQKCIYSRKYQKKRNVLKFHLFKKSFWDLHVSLCLYSIVFPWSYSSYFQMSLVTGLNHFEWRNCSFDFLSDCVSFTILTNVVISWMSFVWHCFFPH